MLAVQNFILDMNQYKVFIYRERIQIYKKKI